MLGGLPKDRLSHGLLVSSRFWVMMRTVRHDVDFPPPYHSLNRDIRGFGGLGGRPGTPPNPPTQACVRRTRDYTCMSRVVVCRCVGVLLCCWEACPRTDCPTVF